MGLKKFQSDVQSVSDEHTRELEKTIEDLQLEVAELRWKEEALRESEKRFRNIALSMVVWIWEIDKKGVYTYCSERVHDILGYTPEEIIGRDFFHSMPPQEVQKAREEFERLSAKRDIIMDFENWNVHKNGTHKCLATSGVPILDESGSFKGYRGVHKDITEQKQAEEALKEANRRLKEFDQLKSDFLSTVSHEIRTPITIMREGISLCIDGVAGDVTEAQKELLTDTLDSVDRLERLVTDLLDLSKIESGKIEIRKSKIDLCQILKKIKKNFNQQVRTKGLSLDLNSTKDSISLFADEDKILQIFSNLVSNAVRYTEPGGKITVRGEEKGEFILCSVTDTGIGISEENLHKVFSKFEQFGRIEGSGYKGTGLGLTIVKGLVEKHDGEIWVESQLGMGTTFYFTIKNVCEEPK